jgi:hypothetical protein
MTDDEQKPECIQKYLTCTCRSGTCVSADVIFSSVAQTCMIGNISIYVARRISVVKRLNGLIH